MAEIEKQEFSFPDEVDKKPEVEDDGGVDVEIETSAPAKKTTSSNDDDELEKYDEKVKKRISDLQSGFHNERRRAEEAAREREEAIAFAQVTKSVCFVYGDTKFVGIYGFSVFLHALID